MTFKKADKGKPRFGLIPPLAELEFVRVLTHGGDRYGDDNWKNCDNWGRYVDALGRHLNAYRAGERNDPESGLHHLAHLICCASFVLEHELSDVDEGAVLPTDPAKLRKAIEEYTGVTEIMRGYNGHGGDEAHAQKNNMWDNKPGRYSTHRWVESGRVGPSATDDPADILLPKDRFCRACD